MDEAFETESARGSVWHRWDPHIHTPGTALNDQYIGQAAWSTFLDAVELADPPIRALGVTDYFSIERYCRSANINVTVACRVWVSCFRMSS